MIDDRFAEVDGPSKGERFKVNRGETFSLHYHGHSFVLNDISHWTLFINVNFEEL